MIYLKGLQIIHLCYITLICKGQVIHKVLKKTSADIEDYTYIYIYYFTKTQLQYTENHRLYHLGLCTPWKLCKNIIKKDLSLSACKICNSCGKSGKTGTATY